MQDGPASYYRSKVLSVSDEPANYYLSHTLSLHDLAYWIAFSRVLGIGPVRFKMLLDFFSGDVETAWKANSTALAAAGIDAKTCAKFIKQRTDIVPERELERLERLNISIITWEDAAYPPLLRKIEYAPPVLYICGSLTEDDRRYTLGIVGTRRMSAYGRQITERFASDLARGQITIVSGLAIGVDTVAHNCAMDVGGRTIAVLASGLDHIYPGSNYQLARRIVESGQGALISAFPLGVKPEPGNFPARNHLISGLSLGVLVTEAPERSGALITAGSALNQGREVFSVPGNIFSPGAAGVNKLIQDGAHPVTSVNDILSNLNLYMLTQQAEVQATLPNSAEEEALMALLGYEALHVDEIIRLSVLSPHAVIATLTTLELKGIIKHIGGMQYVLAR